MIFINEKHYYEFFDNLDDNNKNITYYRNKSEEENKSILYMQMDFSNFKGANLLTGVNIPFQIQVPPNAYPSCSFDNNAYVKHFFVCDFPSIQAKKTIEIIIKNNIYFSQFNGLLKTPTIYNKEITKHKFGLFNSGSFAVSITIPKNIFSYSENIPFVIDIDCPNLSLLIKGINISIYRIYRKNYQKDHNIVRSEYKTFITSKELPLMKGEQMYHLDDIISLPDSELNPKKNYKILDEDNRKHDEKFKNYKLFPSCYGGLLSCEYYIKFIFEIDSFFSSNEEFDLPLDFYEPFNMGNNLNTQSFNQQPSMNNYYNSYNNLNNNNYNNYNNYQSNQFNFTKKPQHNETNQQYNGNNNINNNYDNNSNNNNYNNNINYNSNNYNNSNNNINNGNINNDNNNDSNNNNGEKEDGNEEGAAPAPSIIPNGK